ncbi:MAG: hypothetical protein SNH35_04285 [Rikenellaceae bacterium]
MQVSVKKKSNPEVESFVDTKAELPTLIKRTSTAEPATTPIAAPKVEAQPQKAEEPPKKIATKRPSILNLGELLSGGGNKVAESVQSGTTEVVESNVDPQSEQKLLAAKGNVLSHIAQWRPRFLPFFESMTISGNTISIVVSTSELKDEILRNRTELLTKVVEIASVKGAVELAIEVNEAEKSIKPIKLEDRIAHIMELNPLIAELKEALDLDVEG